LAAADLPKWVSPKALLAPIILLFCAQHLLIADNRAEMEKVVSGPDCPSERKQFWNITRLLYLMDDRINEDPGSVHWRRVPAEGTGEDWK
jgi:hypothetical protein